MDQNVNESSMVSLSDLWTLFVSKIKLLVIVGLLVAIVSGVAGAVMSMFGKRYEAVVKFYVSPSDSTDTLLYNMQSEIYAESLLLNADGLPPAKDCENKADYEAAVNSIAAYNEMRKKKLEKKEKIEEFNADPNKKMYEQEYAYLQQEYERIYDRWSILKSPQTDAVIDEAYFIAVNACEAELQAAKEALDKYYAETYQPYVEEKTLLQGQYDQVSLELNRLTRERNDAVEKVLSAWRSKQEVKEQVARIMASTTYEYTILEVPEGSNQDTAKEGETEIRNKGYITITVSVADDSEFATLLVDKLKNNTSSFIIRQIEEKTGAVRVDCRLISPYSSICEKKNGDMVSNAVKYAVVAVALSEIVLYGVLVVIMCAKKKRSQNEVNE